MLCKTGFGCGKTNVVFDFLSTKNSHERDEHLTFDESPHTYFIDGARVDVTGFLGAFQKPFCPDEVIARMQQYRWPRPGYLNLQHIHKATAFAQKHPPLSKLAQLLQAQPVDKESLCALLQQAPQDQLWDLAKYLLAMTPAEIRICWEQNGEAASRLGAWAHLQCECILNGGQVANPGAEMACLAYFVMFFVHASSIISIHFPSIIHCFPTSSLILFNPCSSILYNHFTHALYFHFHPVSIHFSSFFLFCINVYPISSTVIHSSSIFHQFLFIHFHPFFIFHHWCSSIFALVILSSIYNP